MSAQVLAEAARSDLASYIASSASAAQAAACGGGGDANGEAAHAGGSAATSGFHPDLEKLKLRQQLQVCAPCFAPVPELQACPPCHGARMPWLVAGSAELMQGILAEPAQLSVPRCAESLTLDAIEN